MKLLGSRVLAPLAIAAVLALPASVSAQEATLSGTITDSTGGVLPGVTVTALHEATGNTFVAVTDERGIYPIPPRGGSYRINPGLQGFFTSQRTARGTSSPPGMRATPFANRN